MTRYGSARHGDLPALTALWHTCFGDGPEEIRSFWRNLFDTIRVFVAYEDETPVSMLCAMPVVLVDEEGESLPAAYLYAVCTAPEHRGRGLCAGLTAYAEETLRQDGCRCTALVPEGEGLFRFYEKLGYRTAFFHKEYTVAAGGTAKITPLTAERYQGLRELFLRGAFVSYDLPLLDLQRRCGGKNSGLFRIETPTAICCAAAEKHGDRLLCKELLPDCPESAAALAAALGCADAAVRTEGGALPFGMVKPLGGAALPKFAYLGLAFD